MEQGRCLEQLVRSHQLLPWNTQAWNTWNMPETTETETPGTDQPPDGDLNYDAWCLLANASYWDSTDAKRSAEWDAARTRWRDRWHATL